MSIKGDENEAIQNIGGDPTSDPPPASSRLPIQVNLSDYVYLVALLPEGKQFMSGGNEVKIRRWEAENGMEVGMPVMDTGSTVVDFVQSRDGKWVVAGTMSGQVVVWNSTTFEKVKEINTTHRSRAVRAVDISVVDGTKIATISDDTTLSVWSFLTGERLLGPLKHDTQLVAVKFSPDGKFIAISMWRVSVRVYDSLDGTLLADFPIRIHSIYNGSLAWTGDGKQLFALSVNGSAYGLHVSSMEVVSQWSIHNDDDPWCITLACNDAFMAVSSKSSVSFWDTTTHQQIGPVIDYPHPVHSMEISANYDIVVAGGKAITHRNLHGVLSPSYLKDVPPHPTSQPLVVTSAPEHSDSVPGSRFFQVLAKWKKSISEIVIPGPRRLARNPSRPAENVDTSNRAFSTMAECRRPSRTVRNVVEQKKSKARPRASGGHVGSTGTGGRRPNPGSSSEVQKGKDPV